LMMRPARRAAFTAMLTMGWLIAISRLPSERVRRAHSIV
jgi:hypothetical protein